MSNNIDSLFKKAYQNRHAEPPAYIWENINQQLQVHKRKRKIILWRYRAAAAIALLLAIAGVTILKNTSEVKPAFYSFSAPPVHKLEYTLPTPQLIVMTPAVHPIPVIKERIPEKRTIFPELLPESIGETKVALAISQPSFRKLTPKDYIPLINKQSYKTLRLYQQVLESEQIEKKAVSVSDKKTKILLSGHIAPGYASGSYNTPEALNRDYGYSKDQMSGIFNFSGGMKIAIIPHKRFSIQTGIMYTRMGQKTGESRAYTYMDNSKAPAYILSPLGAVSKKVTHSPLGNIKSRSTAEVVGAPSFIAPKNGSSSEIEQIFDALEIPIAVKYYLNNNKIRFSLLAGFSGSFIISNKAYLNYENNREYIGSTENIRNFNISTDWALGVEYPISPKVKIMLEPGFRYYLQSISEDENIDFKPYIFSFSTGIGINF